jgi:Oxidoreductase family, NAD-binding Rossmann fold
MPHSNIFVGRDGPNQLRSSCGVVALRRLHCGCTVRHANPVQYTFQHSKVSCTSTDSWQATHDLSLRPHFQLKTAAESLVPPESSLDSYHDRGGSPADLDALLNSPSIDAVIIALPSTVQPGINLAALQAGRHVLNEKPVAADLSSGRNTHPMVCTGALPRTSSASLDS